MDECDILTPAQAAELLGIKADSVRVTMNRRGFTEVRGYRRSDVLAVQAGRQRRRSSQTEAPPE